MYQVQKRKYNVNYFQYNLLNTDPCSGFSSPYSSRFLSERRMSFLSADNGSLQKCVEAYYPLIRRVSLSQAFLGRERLRSCYNWWTTVASVEECQDLRVRTMAQQCTWKPHSFIHNYPILQIRFRVSGRGQQMSRVI